MEPREPQDHPEGSLEARIVEVLRTCYDPEIPVDIYEMGLIYAIDVEEAPEAGTEAVAASGVTSGDGQTTAPRSGGGRRVVITMTLTSPACPVAGTLPIEVQQKVTTQVEAVSQTRVDITWDPPWSIDRMSDAAKLQLGMM